MTNCLSGLLQTPNEKREAQSRRPLTITFYFVTHIHPLLSFPTSIIELSVFSSYSIRHLIPENCYRYFIVRHPSPHSSSFRGETFISAILRHPNLKDYVLKRGLLEDLNSVVARSQESVQSLVCVDKVYMAMSNNGDHAPCPPVVFLA